MTAVSRRIIGVADERKASTPAMRRVAQQLDQVRRLARWLLLAQRVGQLVCVLGPVVVLCGLLDYALRLPGWFRLAIGGIVAVTVLAWLGDRGRKILRFRPALSLLAMRAERLYPQLAGVLASGVELAITQLDEAVPEATRALTQVTVTDAQKQVRGLSLRRLIAPGRTVRTWLLAIVVLLGFVGIVAGSPQASLLAARRWLAPLGDATWPRRTHVQSLVTELVWPSDTPLRFRARVNRGYGPGMRTWVAYRLLGDGHSGGVWQHLLMSEQVESSGGANDAVGHPPGSRPGVFERLVDLTQRFGQSVTHEDLPQMAFYFLAGDDRTAVQTLRLVARPSVMSVTAAIEPPTYARGLIRHQTMDLDPRDGQVASVSALLGSTVQLHVAVNKPVAAGPDGWAGIFPGLGGRALALSSHPAQDRSEMDLTTQIRHAFVLDRSLETPIRIMDQHGLGNLSERRYRIVATVDGPPAVSLIQPAVDQAVLPTAMVEVEAVAQDDVGVEKLRLESRIHKRDGDHGEGSEGQLTVLEEVSGRRPRLNARHGFDLRPLDLQPGDELALEAVVQDVFEHDGQRHEPVRAPTRRLRIIDSATLMGQIQTELAGVRQQAIRLLAQQRDVLDQPPDRANPKQRRVTAVLEAQGAQLAALRQRVHRNRLDPNEAGQLQQLLESAGSISQEAESLSRVAGQLLEQAHQRQDQDPTSKLPVRDQQDKVVTSLTQLISLLDQGRDALALQLQLRQLKALQDALAAETRRLMPLTVGWSIDELNKQELRQLQDLADRQQAVTQQMQALVNRMQATSDALLRQGERPGDQATAQVLAEAASIARRQGLVGTLQQAAQKAQQNQLSDAGNDQHRALGLMDQMLAQLAEVEQRRQAILRRRLVQLADAIRQLIKQQEAQLTALGRAVDLAGLEGPLAALRKKTVVVAVLARAAPPSQEAGAILDHAADEQVNALTALRQLQRQPAVGAQRSALAHMQRALDLIEQQRHQSQADQLLRQRLQLQQAYEQLAKTQKQLRDETTQLVGLAALSRIQRAASVQIGHRQADLQIAVRELTAQVEQILVFVYLHRQIDQEASVVVSRMRKVQPDEDVLSKQAAIHSMLRQMAQAIAIEPPDQPFAGRHGGAGGASGGRADSMIPPVAQLKLLRAMQQGLHRSTQEVDQPAGRQRVDPQVLADLSRRQRELAGLSQKLNEMVRQPPSP